MEPENEHLEYKLQASENLYREVIAFANTDGGVIFVGVDDKGNVIGIDNVDETYSRITNGIRDAIQPDVTMFVRYFLQHNRVIRIEISEGSLKPYFLKAKGLRPSGVYVRQGASSVQASVEQIRKMIKQSDGDIFENMPSQIQELTFTEATRSFAKYGVDFSEDKYVALGMRNPVDGKYTKLAWIMSDQCQHSVKVAVFVDEARTVFRDAQEFKGSVFKQLEDCFNYLMYCNRTSAVVQGLVRVETRDYPEGALREALLNALIHRDYDYSGSIIININDSFAEIISLGGLLPGLLREDLGSGISLLRNKNLAEIFHRFKLIECYGTGVRKIFDSYKGAEAQPQIVLTPNTFKLILPSMNASLASKVMAVKEEAQKYTVITAQMKKVVEYLEERGSISEAQLQELVQVKKTRAYLLARQMCQMGITVSEGRGAGKLYYLNK